MALRIGRITGLNEPNDWDSQNDHVTLTGSYRASSLNDGLIRREQLLGYGANVDEPVVPVIIDGESRVNGFYRINSVRILTDVFARQRGNLYDFQVDMDRIRAFRAPYIESFLTGALMVNALGITTTAEPFHAYPLSAFEYTNGASGFTVEARPLADGSTTVEWVRMNPTGAAPTYKALARFGLDPSHYYDAACEIRSSDPADHVVVGLQESPTSIVWTLRNGLVSLSMFTYQDIRLLWADATNTYRTQHDLAFDGAGAGRLFSVSGLTSSGIKILRNAPEECIIRVPMSQTTAGLAWTPITLDIAIRRGSRIVRFYLTAGAADTWTFGSYLAGGVASSAITGGNVWASNDANGNRVGIFSAKASTNDLAKGKITASASLTTFDSAVAFELAGTGSVNRDTIASQVLQYLGGAGGSQAERMQIVGR